jgi:hypothetical protein
MKLFRDLLLENPDTVYYKQKTYSYRSPANKCAFLVYEDEKSGKKAIFGYSFVKKDFYCDDPEVLKDIDELSKQSDIKLDTNKNTEDQLNYWGQRAITNLKNGNSGGGHLDIENLLKGIGRFGIYADPLLKGRIFEVDDAKDVVDDSDLKIESTIPSGKAIIVTFWDSKRDRIIKYKDQYDKVIGFNGYDPKECLYEPSMKFYTYDEFYNNEEPKKETPPSTPKPSATDEADKFFKVGDKVQFKGMGIKAVIKAIKGNILSLKVTDSDWNTTPVGSEFDYPYWGVDKLEQQPSLEKVIDDKTQEFVEKRGKLHSTGAAFTSAEKQNLEKEVDSLEIEIKILNDLLTSGEKSYTDNVKSVVATSVQRKLDAKQKEKQDRYSLIAQAEKQYGMPIAQIRQKYRNVPLDQLVKKESKLKEILRSLLYRRKFANDKY